MTSPLAVPNINDITGNLNTTGASWAPPMLLDPNHLDRLFVGSQSVWVNLAASTGNNWTQLSQPLPVQGSVSAIAVASGDGSGNTLWAGTNDGLFYAGTSATTLTAWSNITTNLPGRAITSLQADGSATPTLYARLSGFGTFHVSKLANGGTTWTDISGDLPNVPVNVIRLVGTALYIGTDLGVYQSINGGTNWTIVGTGQPFSQVQDLIYQPATNRLISFTHGRGAWAVTLTTTTYTLTVNTAGGCGSTNPSGATQQALNAQISIVATAGANCTFTGWTINSGGVTCANGLSNSPCGFTMPRNAVTVTATFVVSTNTCPPTITTPTPGGSLAGSSQTFQWAPCNTVTGYWLWVGTGTTGSQQYNISAGQQLSANTTSTTINGLPASGTVYVRFWYLQGTWQSTLYTFTGTESSPTPGGLGGTLGTVLRSAVEAVKP